MKKRNQLASVLLVLLLALFLTPFVCAEYEQGIREDIFLVRPDNIFIPERVIPSYLSTEDLLFYACIEYDDAPTRLSILCSENNNFIDIPATKWGPENCYAGSVNLADFPCSDAVITADYVHDGENFRITKEIKINTVTGALQRILENQFEDGGWSSAIDTAYVLFSLKPFQVALPNEIEKGLIYLKNTRDEINKCWPADQCQVSTTAAITYLLNQAPYDDTLRIVKDSSVYLEKTMNYLDGSDVWTLTIEDFLANQNNTVNTSCVYGYDTANTTFNISKYGQQRNITITPQYYSIVRLVCTENVYVDIASANRGHLIHYEGDNMSYTIPGACWTFNNENIACDLRATTLALGAPIDKDKKTAAIDYLKKFLTTTATGEQFIDGDLMNTALLLKTVDTSVLATDDREAIIKYLRYKQLNKGGWNVTDTYYNHSFFEPQLFEITNKSHVLNDSYTRSIVYTGFITQALMSADYTREDEIIQDAERWVSLHEESVSTLLSDEDAADTELVASYDQNVSDILKDPKRNAMAFYVLQQHARPYIKTNPRVVVLDTKNKTIELTNPTMFTLDHLSYEISSDIQPYISLETKDYLAPFSFRKIVLTQTVNRSVSTFGFIRILSNGEEYAKIPVVISSYPALDISFPSELVVFGTTTIMPLNITKSSHNFSCSLQWKDAGITAPETFTIERNENYNLPIQFTASATEETDYGGLITCVAETSTFKFPFTVHVLRFLTKPLSVTPSSLSADQEEQQFSFSVKNLLDESVDVTFSLREPSTYVDFSDEYVNLYPGETRNITVFTTIPAGENVSMTNAIIVKTFNVEERILLQIDVVHETKPPRPLWIVLAVITFSGGMLALLVYFFYSNRKKIYTWYNKKFSQESERQKFLSKVKEYEQREEAIAIKNMIEILKMEGVPDKDVRKRLVTEGFSEEDIVAALKMKIEEPAPKPAPATTQQK